uniref:CSN8/PSMD8/EIF3K domain-containing protein n=1 Tax=Brassica campestris TaxID=3711 RepID=M4EVC7_BRACM
MDLSPVTEALAVKSFDKIADICDNLMLQVASEGISFHDDWPYAIHLLGYFYVDDCDSARFLWKTIPTSVKESKPEVVAAWRIGQRLWTRDYAGVYEAIRGYDWSPEAKDMVAAFSAPLLHLQDINCSMPNAIPVLFFVEDVYTKRMFQLLLSAYSTITIRDLALFLGMTEDDATTYVAENGWTVDTASQMVTVKKQAVKREQKVDSSKLQRLTEYVFHLEH